MTHINATHELADGDALINYTPIILSHRLLRHIVDKLVEGLGKKDRFYTRWGFASESVSSFAYHHDRYWRGPIWAPQVFYMVEGLRMAGAEKFAREAAQRYIDMCMYSGTFAENFDALNGIGLRDTSYSWGADVFQYFVHKYS